ncbi:hypothetical protein RPMA_03515 [Tardiphaga alba]|uniref:Uncharacterized protein n=1 Tax=Tardiphaga alba TaxID=340268 RepID=A0ABX8A5Q2_9BRAD|nr:hypothetical protein [Tardiphaga alba]QUS38029.1 hypothetical protein RPMA_03515 [Tardiphaga alba]
MYCVRAAVRIAMLLVLFASLLPADAWSEAQPPAQLAQVTPTDRVRPGGFVVGADAIAHSAKPGLFVRLGERISRQALKRRFIGYDVRYTKEEGCLICAVITGPDGQFDIDFDKDGRTVARLRTSDDRIRDAQGNRRGSPLRDALGTDTAICDAGETTTCVATAAASLHYMVAEDERCAISVTEKQPTKIPACARIDGFQLDAPETTPKKSEDYTLVCRSQLHQSSNRAEITTKVGIPITVKVQFTGGETTWIDPRDKTETVFENLTASIGNQIVRGGQVKGSTFGSSTSYDSSFGPTGRAA